MVGHGGSSAGSYLVDPTSPIPSHCESIVGTSTLRVNILNNKHAHFHSSTHYSDKKSPNTTGKLNKILQCVPLCQIYACIVCLVSVNKNNRSLSWLPCPVTGSGKNWDVTNMISGVNAQHTGAVIIRKVNMHKHTFFQLYFFCSSLKQSKVLYSLLAWDKSLDSHVTFSSIASKSNACSIDTSLSNETLAVEYCISLNTAWVWN